ncbi:MAG: hypothetical protein ACRDK7_11075 [Solirubrobacteraceae bacterium]
MEEHESVWVVLFKAAAALAPAALFMYYSDPSFRHEVDRTWARVRYRAQLADWRARVWDRLEGWQREVWEQRHGPLEG